MVAVPGRLLLFTARAAVGPLALAAFFSEWGDGTGVLAGRPLSGFDLVGLTGRLQSLDLDPWETVALWAVRLGVIGVAIAGAWQLILVFGLHRHPAYALSGWYLAAVAALVLILSIARHGVALPSGAILLAAAATAFVVSSRGLREGRRRAEASA